MHSHFQNAVASILAINLPIPFFIIPYFSVGHLIRCYSPTVFMSACWAHVNDLLLVNFEEVSFLSSPAYSLLPTMIMSSEAIVKIVYYKQYTCNMTLDPPLACSGNSGMVYVLKIGLKDKP